MVTGHKMRKGCRLRLGPALILAACLWTIALGTLFTLISQRFRAQACAGDLREARSTVERDLLYQRWAASQGGVYVPVAPLLAVANHNSMLLLWGLGTVWLAELVGITTGGLFLRRCNAERAAHATVVRASEERYRNLSENSPDIVARFDRDARYLFINRAVERYAPQSVATYLGKSNEELGLPVELCRLWRDALTEAFISGEVQQFTCTLPRRRTPLIFDCRLVPERNESGVQTVLALVRDVTAHRRAEEEIARRERRLNVIFETSPAGIVMVGLSGQILLANRRMSELFAYSDAELGGLFYTQLIHPEEREEGDERMHKLLTGSVQQVLSERRYLRRDGSSFWGLLAGRRVMGENGRLEALIGIISDISDRKQTEVELRAAKGRAEMASLAKSAFLANMSHELRTPLNGVLGMLQVLGMTTLDDEQQECVSIAVTSSWNLLSLINDLLDLSRIETGLLQIEEAPLPIRDLINGCLLIFYAQAAQQGLVLQSQVAETVPAVVEADGTRLRQLVYNLIGNAVKFTAAGKVSLSLQAYAADRPGRLRLELVVHDTGIGMSEELLARIFEPFTQADDTYQRRFQGAGLGLSLVKRLAEMMGGGVTITSRLGSGTTVTATFEVGSADATVAEGLRSPIAAAVAPVASLRILLAEDNPINQMAMIGLLARVGHRVRAVENGRQVLEALRDESFDLILMDVQMPEMGGIEALRLVRSDTSGCFDPAIPVVGVTAYAMATEHATFLAAGMDACLSKPVSLVDLEKALAKYVAARLS